MDINKAKELQRGTLVYCPADRGSPAFEGKVVSVGAYEHKTPNGTPYVWVTVRGPNESVWPSNRLSEVY